ncbi:MAG: hypothetical protein PUI98_03820 [Finegoldia magna]|nr:hypothetical protein [Finegoldia magna]
MLNTHENNLKAKKMFEEFCKRIELEEKKKKNRKSKTKKTK